MATIFILLMTSQAMSLFLALYHLSDYLISRRRKKEGSHRTKGPLELVGRGTSAPRDFDLNQIIIELEIKPCGLGSRIQAEWKLKVITDLIS